MWKEQQGAIHKKFIFADFKQAFKFMSMVAEVAENQNHHPKWLNTYNEVEIWLNTHEAGDKVTKKDKTLASSIDKIYRRISIENT